MLEEKFEIVYTKFKLHFYQEIFARFQNREASLTTVETFAMETIQALGSPTVNEFASFMKISPPNAAYKINSYVHMVTERIRERFSPEECAKLEEMLAIVDQELMPEVDLGQAETT